MFSRRRSQDQRYAAAERCASLTRPRPPAMVLTMGSAGGIAEERPGYGLLAAEVAAILASRYGAWEEEGLPVLDQLCWFLLSARTTVENCDAAYAALRAAYPSWEAAAAATIDELAPLLRPAGLQRARAASLLGSLEAVRDRFGETSLEGLRRWPDADCEAFLLTLPGVGLKVARCVLSFGLGRPSFAVDAHIWR